MAEDDYHASNMTAEHVLEIGWIIVAWNMLERQLDNAILSLLTTERVRGLLAISQMSYPQKRDLLRVLIDVCSAPDERKQALHDIVNEIDQCNRIRDTCAHGTWTNGRKSGAIKPWRLRARGKIVVLGFDHNEQEYTVETLKEEAVKSGRLIQRIVDFLRGEGLMPAEDSIADTNSTTAASNAAEPPK